MNLYIGRALQARFNIYKRGGDSMMGRYFCFSIRPWFRNIPKSLRKQPKIYLWDWSVIRDPGARHENFIASHAFQIAFDLNYIDRDCFSAQAAFLPSLSGLKRARF